MAEIMGSSNTKSPIDVLQAFYEAERRYMAKGGKAGGASFDEFAVTMAPDVVLHQTPDLPWGGEYAGVEAYSDWAAHMSSVFAMCDVQNAEFAEVGDKVIVLSTLVTQTKGTGEWMKRPMVHVVTVKNDKIVDFRPFYWHVPDYVKASDQAKSFTSQNGKP